MYSYGHLLEQSEQGQVFIDKVLSNFDTLEEARDYIKQNTLADKLEEEIAKELYEDLNSSTIASVIKEHHDIKVTDTIIESYIDLASSKVFTLDPVVLDIRQLNKLDTIIEGKLDFTLEDGSVLAINEVTYNQINNILNEHSDVIDYMRKSKDNFMSVVSQLEG
jgi:hypothetical protein